MAAMGADNPRLLASGIVSGLGHLAPISPAGTHSRPACRVRFRTSAASDILRLTKSTLGGAEDLRPPPRVDFVLPWPPADARRGAAR